MFNKSNRHLSLSGWSRTGTNELQKSYTTNSTETVVFNDIDFSGISSKTLLPRVIST
jgi:hypothetical protein